MTRADRQYRFRPPPELAAKLDEYCQRERRRSVNEALIVLVSDALERWRPTPQAQTYQRRCPSVNGATACALTIGHDGLHKSGCGTWL